MKKRLCRSERDKVFCGVCSGIAEYFNIDPVLVRLAAVALFALNPGAVIVAYVIACIIMPKEPCTKEKVHEEVRHVVEEIEESIRKEEVVRTIALILGLALIVLGVILITSSMWPDLISVIRYLWSYIVGFSNVLTGLVLLIVGLILVLAIALRGKQTR